MDGIQGLIQRSEVVYGTVDGAIPHQHLQPCKSARSARDKERIKVSRLTIVKGINHYENERNL
jgi:hypothetical protein